MTKKPTYKELEFLRKVWMFVGITMLICTWIFMVFGWGFMKDIERLQLENQQLEEQINTTPTICYFVNEITARTWIPEKNLIVGQTTYIENITQEDCRMLP